MRPRIAAVLFGLAFVTAGGNPDRAAAFDGPQTPQPFPRPPSSGSAQPAPRTPEPTQAPAAPAAPAAADPNAPTSATLGITIYPAAQFLASYDAGRGQRYYIFGTTASFADIVTYYRTELDERGDLIYKDPPTHMFTGGRLGRYRDETMAFPPSVTVKDWSTVGESGYPHPRLGGQPARFPTTIMIVPAPATAR